MSTTPRSRAQSFINAQQQYRPLNLKHGAIEVSVLTPVDIWGSAEQLREEFQAVPLPETLADDELTQIDLISLFLRFAVDRAEEEEVQSFYPVVRTIFFHLRESFLKKNDVHAATRHLPLANRNIVIYAYFYALSVLTQQEVISPDSCPAPTSALFTAASNKDASLFAVFGGQGNSEEYFDELVELFSTYRGIVSPFISQMSDVLCTHALSPDASALHSKGLNVLRWLEFPETRPDINYLITAPVSLPTIGLIQLAHYYVTMKVLGMTPEQMRNHFVGATGHSQGIISAVAIASSSDEESFFKNSEKALGLLFWIGTRAQETYPQVTLNPAILKDSISNGEGNPSVMLAIFNLRLAEVEKHVKATNEHLPEERQISIDLVNGPRSIICVGHPQSLNGLNLALRKIKAPDGLDQSRVPHSKRKVKFSSRFLPITAPFHSKNLALAPEIIDADVVKHGLQFQAHELAISVLATDDGRDLRNSTSLTGDLIRQICTRPINWEAATNASPVTHIIDFGPGGVSGIGSLTHRNKEGTGVQVILAGTLQGSKPNLSYKADLFDTVASAVKYSPNWAEVYKPKLVRLAKSGKVLVDTRMSRFIGKPPLMVAGMTPCTVPAKFVAAVINAGYHVEMAGGGHFSEPMFRAKVQEIMSKVQPGEGITVNILFLNAFQWGFQFPLVQAMRREGFPLEGLCCAAGVPSPDIANDVVAQIQAAGLKHIAFKPGSVSAIRQVVAIAAKNPTFPIILQWTGGRAGGHHSFEDFHQPILETYATIRQQSNIVLVAGSGFGSSEDTLPYITGDWSKDFDYPPMPFDGVLFGSRVMVAAENMADDTVKQAIVDAPGVDDKDWENTYTRETGGILTVKSELGEPIHKVATRGIKFWKEMDDLVFSLPRNKRQPILDAKKDYIIKRLNDDFQKPWFGRKADGSAADLQDMTYSEVVNRLVEVTYVKHQKRWIDITLRRFVGDFMCRLEERFITKQQPSLLQDYQQIHDPFTFIPSFLEAYPEASKQLLTTEDVQFFLSQCLRVDQKPVPFIPILDANFEYWMKKDSLWQSEDIHAIPDQDVGRAAILHGPMAARHSTKANVPVKEILDSIHDGQVANLLERFYGNNLASVPTVEYLGGQPSKYPQTVHRDVLLHSNAAHPETLAYETGSLLPETDEWLELISGPKKSWLRALLTSSAFVQGDRYVNNPLRQVFRPRQNQKAVLTWSRLTVVSSLKLYDVKESRLVLQANFQAPSSIQVTFYERKGADEVPLTFPFDYRPDQGYALIHEFMEGRNDRIKDFYYRLWFNSTEFDQLPNDPNHIFVARGEKIVRSDITRFCQAVGNQSEAYVDKKQDVLYAPVDFAIVVGWKSIIKAIFPKFIDGDLLKLVHLSNGFKMVEGASPLQSGDVVDTHARLAAVVNTASGKMVHVKANVKRDGNDVMEVDSQFLYRGVFTDFENTFRNSDETPMEITLPTLKDIAVLQSKPWFVWEREDLTLLPGAVLTFRLSTTAKFKDADTFSELRTAGHVTMQVSTKELVHVASVNYVSGQSLGNPVIEYLKRTGTPIDQATMFDNGGYSVMPRGEGFSSLVQTPATNVSYARISQDLNPIHVNPYFADLAGLPGTITHGMWSSASARKFVETFAAENFPFRVTSYSVSFQAMVLPGDQLTTNLFHVGMQKGKKVIKVETVNQAGVKVLEGTAEVDQPSTAYVFTGQGSQEVGMGMALYDSSPVARAIWDKADAHYIKFYGFSILDIVRNNPKQRTVHFGGAKGKLILKNYMDMRYDIVLDDGSVKTLPLFPTINERSSSYTFKSPNGLLSSTQFTQPALTLMEKAAFEDMRMKGLVQCNCPFAGHSLGEYSALASLGEVIPLESIIDLVFYRGMTMQSAVQRDELGRSNFSMMAVNPSRVSRSLNEEYLKYVVDAIAHHSSGLLQIVNYNVENMQYVVAGELANLETLTNVLNYMKSASIDIATLMKTMTIEQVKDHLSSIIAGSLAQAQEKKARDGFLVLERGYATIPLSGIDVPFHSAFLMSGVVPFRSYILLKIATTDVDVSKLTGKYIPNLTAAPFDLSKAYFARVLSITNSPRIAKVLKNWDDSTTFTPAQSQQLGYILLVELLAYQFASPVRWIETQDVLFKDFNVERLIEVGPSPTLANMANRTLQTKYAAYDDARNVQRTTLCCSKHEKEIYYIMDPEEAEPAPVQPEVAAPVIAAVAAPVAAAVASPVARGPAQAIQDAPLSAANVLHIIIAQKLKKELSQVPMSKTIKDVVGGKSTLQNEILGDLQKEFGSNVPEKPEETPLDELGASIAPAFNGALGKHTSSLISKLIAAKLPGGFTQTNAREYLSSSFGLGSGRTDGVLLLALTKEPAARLANEADAKAWLDSVAQAYASNEGITLSAASAGAAGGSSGGAVIDSAEFNTLTKKQNALYRRQIQLLAQHIGDDQFASANVIEAQKLQGSALQAEVDAFHAEHGEFYVQGVKPIFDANKCRVYDSFWNWSRQDLLTLYYDFVFGRLTAVDRDVMAQCIHLMNRSDKHLVEFMQYIISKCPKDKNENYRTAKEFGTLLISNVQQTLDHPPVYKDVNFPTAPSTQITEKGDVIYKEVLRPNVRKLGDYVAEMETGSKLTEFSGRNLIRQNLGKLLKLVSYQPNLAKGYKEAIKSLHSDVAKALSMSTPSPADKAVKPTRPSRAPITKKSDVTQKERLPFLLLKSKHPIHGWEYDPKKTALYLQTLASMARSGQTFKAKNVLITGCGRNSIGAEILCGLLSGGAQVYVTTSRFNRAATEYYQGLYQRYGSKGSSLIVVPFNQGSKQDVENIVNFIYSRSEASGLGVDLDFIIPFGAIPENGREISDLDGLSEFAHRVMLTNLMRLLGAVKAKKVENGFHTRPAQVLIPLSPNHGLFGGDGLYSESKIGLENLLNRWYSESWGAYLSIVGTVIGWTRGTGLMNQNNIVSEDVEKLGVRTFSTQEMAFNILGLMHPTIASLAQDEPVWADLNGGFQYLPNFKDALSKLRQNITETSAIRRAITSDNALDFNTVNGPSAADAFQTRMATPRSNIQLDFPTLKSYNELSHIHHLRGTIDLEKVVVVTGFGEVSPFGSSRTRWEMEAYGEFSLEGCVELAWVMGFIRHHNGPLKSGGKHTGWVDAKTGEPVPEFEVKKRYEAQILEHTGVRLIEPELFQGYNPDKHLVLREIMVDHDLEAIEVSAEEAAQFKHQHGDKVHVFEIKETGSWSVQLLKGSTIMVPKALRGDRLVAGQVPTGWDPIRYGIPEDIVNQVDRVTLFVLVSTVEALVSSGITDPYEFYKYVHVSEVGNTSGSGMGGLVSLRHMYKDRLRDQPIQNDILQETFINTMPAWINLLLLSSSGPIKTPVGACATAVESVEIGVDTILSGKAKVVIAGGFDDFHEEGSVEFANMKATSNTLEEFARGRTPKEMSRPATTSRAGFMESHGSGIQVLMNAKLAVEMGVPIYGIVALTNTATDKEGRSVPAPGQGILTTARESSNAFTSPLLDSKYRAKQIQLARANLKGWIQDEYRFLNQDVQEKKARGELNDETEAEFVKERSDFISKEAHRQESDFLKTWGNEFYKQDPSIAPLRGALAVFGLTIDDIGAASFHGTSTKANDKNESDVVDKQFKHLGRSKGNACPSIFQKYLTGHPKGAAAAWMMNGMLQVLQTGIIPGNRNADNIDIVMKKFEFVLYPSCSIHTDGVKAGFLKSFGFGQVGGEALVIHPDYLLGALSRNEYEVYSAKCAERQAKAYRYFHDSITGVADFVRVKHEAPYAPELESSVYLNPQARASFNSSNNSYSFKDASSRAIVPSTDSNLTKDILSKLSIDQEHGVGVDVELVSAIDINNLSFIESIFTPQEISYCQNHPDPQASFAGKWAAKEAALKAYASLTSKPFPSSLKQVEIVIGQSNAPKVVFHSEKVHSALSSKDIKVSISHSGAYAVALAFAN
ncbi:fatty acid synthase alpha subunit Lsd1 [Entomophthora muscae]|uniref:Fatty acid synthase alpha subunit Lsd1 n=1 Tax=Entomophthora muscae TaxID=34485 RepID=A0ACC2SFD4_9FUNG|nr:fatty acid synthase alpha subunit Lsd1 [Entomophthora muscae]